MEIESRFRSHAYSTFVQLTLQRKRQAMKIDRRVSIHRCIGYRLLVSNASSLLQLTI